MSRTMASSRIKIVSFLIFLIGLACFLVGLVFVYLYLISGNSEEQEKTDIEHEEFIQSIQEFEQSQFCRDYECVYLGNYGSVYAYEISNYPEYNEFFIELTIKNEIITVYSIMLDPKDMESEEYQLIELFLASYSRSTELDSKISEFIQQHLYNRVSQICESDSIEYGSRRLWVGNVGSPVLLVAKDCPR